jgi:hypothetical protein
MIIRHQKHERSAHKVREKHPAHSVHRPGMKMVSSGQEERLRRLAYPNFRANLNIPQKWRLGIPHFVTLGVLS